MLKCISHGLKVAEWVFECLNLETEIWRGYIERSSLHPLVDSSYQAVSHVVTSTFVKRWYLETDTFHMSFREMTIALDDVSTLLSIPVVGNNVSSNI